MKGDYLSMRDASGELNDYVEYCKMILNAETEEEIEAIKETIPQKLREQGYNDVQIKNWINRMDFTLEILENREMSIEEYEQTMNVFLQLEGNKYYNVPDSIKEDSQAETLQPIPGNITIADYAPKIIGGLTFSVILGCIALKKKALKNKKNKSL